MTHTPPLEPIIEVRNLGKRYKIRHFRGGYIALRDVLMTILKRPFSFLKTKAKAVIGRNNTEDFWALKDVNFDIMPGEIVGIIGSNGAGKSTLLKILTSITPPTTGEVILRGRVASLLEVGTGFHPELTGRENIFLNGAILGMKKKEMIGKFDDIVAFAGIEKFLDTPVKYYSSGMYVRLAFSVAAHLDPDILLVDEVLAVGDAEFQKKCMGKMEEVSSTSGRTILFVSHNMAAIAKLCKKCILLEKGQVKMVGPTEEVIAFYTNEKKNTEDVYHIKAPANAAELPGFSTSVSIIAADGTIGSVVPVGIPWKARITFTLNKPVRQFRIAMGMKTATGIYVRVTWSAPQDLEAGTYEADIGDPRTILVAGYYLLNFGLMSFETAFQFIDDVATLELTEKGNDVDENRILRTVGGSLILTPMDITIRKINNL